MAGEKSLEGKVVVVTGAGGGIGRDIALACGQEGASVVVNDLGVSLQGEKSGESLAEKVVAEIKAAGGQAAANADSVADPAGAERIVKTAVDTFGRIDGVVNNAGILRDAIFHKMSFNDFKAVIDVHLMGTFNVSKAACAYFKDQGSGSYVHFTSTAGLIGNMGQANYSAAKLGIMALSKSIALDMSRFNVRSNCVAPFAWTRMIASIPTDTPAQKARVEKFKTMSTAKVAPMVAFLLSDLAKDVNAQVFGVRKNELYLFSQSRILRSVHSAEGWTPKSIAETAIPAMKSSFYGLDTSPSVVNWDPI
jgi:NAD(P)-dependent dehydrogenase (short-subunit alcohol dehydrogenase family)